MMFRREKPAAPQRPSHHALELSHVTYRFGARGTGRPDVIVV